MYTLCRVARDDGEEDEDERGAEADENDEADGEVTILECAKCDGKRTGTPASPLLSLE